MKKFLLFIFSLVSVALFGQEYKNNSLTVQIDGWGNDTIIVVHYNWTDSEEIFDTIVATNGQVFYNMPPNDTISLKLISMKNMVPRKGGNYMPISMSISTIGLPDSHEKIVGQLAPCALKYSASGSLPYFTHAAEVRSLYLPYDIAADSLEKLLITASERGLSAAEEDSLFADRRRNYDHIRRVKLEYARNYPGEDIAAACVASQTLENFNKSLEILTPSVRMGLFKERLDAKQLRVKQYEKHLEAQKDIVVGSKAPDFKLPSLDGKELSLSDFKGRWVLLDFWGSWCGWCKKGFPYMKNSYEKHKAKMEIVGIACKDTPEKWKVAVKKNQLPWTQLINLDNSVNNVIVRYAIEGFPTKILISPEGIITEICVGEDLEFYKKLDERFSNSVK